MAKDQFSAINSLFKNEGFYTGILKTCEQYNKIIFEDGKVIRQADGTAKSDPTNNIIIDIAGLGSTLSLFESMEDFPDWKQWQTYLNKFVEVEFHVVIFNRKNQSLKLSSLKLLDIGQPGGSV